MFCLAELALVQTSGGSKQVDLFRSIRTLGHILGTFLATDFLCSATPSRTLPSVALPSVALPSVALPSVALFKFRFAQQCCPSITRTSVLFLHISRLIPLQGASRPRPSHGGTGRSFQSCPPNHSSSSNIPSTSGVSFSFSSKSW